MASRAPAISAEGERRAALVELFLAEHVRHMSGKWAGKAFLLEAWQREKIIRPIFGTLDRRGRRKYREAIIGLPRWGGKSELAAALCLAMMFIEPVYEGEYVVVARNRQQAGIVFNKAKRMILADPYLRSIATVYRSSIVIEETGQVFRVLAWDADTAQGIHAVVAVIDEYHVHRDASMRYAILSGMLAHREALLITISTAGEERKGPLWDLLREAPRDPRAYVYWIGATDAEDGSDPKTWRRANPQSWVTVEMLRDAFRSMPFPEFERYHLNRFPSRGTNRAFSAELWLGLSDRPVLGEKATTILGLDASLTRDTTALVMDQRDGSGFHNVAAWVWGAGRPMGDIDHEVVEGKIAEICDSYRVARIVCDRSYFTASMRRLEELGLPVEVYPQSPERMALASMNLYDLILEGRIRHGGDRELTEAILNCGVKPTAYGWRITKVEEALKIDAAVALAMAAIVAESEAAEYVPSFAETGGIYTLEL